MAAGEPELRLRLGIGEDRSSGDADSAKVCRDEKCFERKEKCQEKQKQQQQQQQQQLLQNKQITIFYKGQICICDVTEIQARAIISTANEAMQNTANKNGQYSSIDTSNHYKHRQVHSISPHGRNMNPPQFVNSGLTMKRSLQRFLQKRKARLSTASYDARIRELLSSSIS